MSARAIAWAGVMLVVTVVGGVFAWARQRPFTTDTEIAALARGLEAEEANALERAGCAASDARVHELSALLDDSLPDCEMTLFDSPIAETAAFHDDAWAARHGLRIAEHSLETIAGVPNLEDEFASGVDRGIGFWVPPGCDPTFARIAAAIDAADASPCEVLRSGQDTTAAALELRLVFRARFEALTDLDRALETLVTALRLRGAIAQTFAPSLGWDEHALTFAVAELLLALDAPVSTGTLTALADAIDVQLARAPTIEALIDGARRGTLGDETRIGRTTSGHGPDLIPYRDIAVWGVDRYWRELSDVCTGLRADGCITAADQMGGDPPSESFRAIRARVLGPWLARPFAVTDRVRLMMSDGERVQSFTAWPLRLAALRVLVAARLHRATTGECVDAAWASTPAAHAVLATPWLDTPFALEANAPGRLDVVLPAAMFTERDRADGRNDLTIMEIYCPLRGGIGPSDPADPPARPRD